MLPTRNELALQLAVLAKLHPEWTMSELAGGEKGLGWPPLFLINAFEEGQAMGLFTVDRNEDSIKLVDLDPMASYEGFDCLGVEMERLIDEILYSVATGNKEEQDVSFEQYRWSWLKGVPIAHLEIAIEVLKGSGLVGEYKLNDPYDEDSVYTFLSLASNAEHQWGSKQFKPRSKASKKRMKKERGEK